MVVGVVAISLVLLVMMNLVNSPFQFQLAKKLFTRQKGVVSELAISRIPDFSMEFRLRSWQYAWSLFLEHPLCGIGLANLRIAQPWHPQLSKPETGVAYVDNQYLHILTETGLIGTLAWLLLIVPISVTALRNLIRSSDKQWLILNSFLLGALTLYAIGGLFWVLTAGLITQSMLAIIFSLIMSSKQLAVNAHD